ncbi:MAG: SoxR reducing system RseC family protein, partial [Megasphaera micronuciformis]|nr:SoxR reducing system RseC family protein [Megasphaera micronuciformis]
ACEGAKDIVVTAVNKVNAKEGQHVKFEFHDTNIVVGAFICFVMPFLLAAAGAIIGYFVSGSFGTDAVRSEVVGAIVAFCIGLGGVKYFDRSLSKSEKSKPKVIEIIEG